MTRGLYCTTSTMFRILCGTRIVLYVEYTKINIKKNYGLILSDAHTQKKAGVTSNILTNDKKNTCTELP